MNDRHPEPHLALIVEDEHDVRDLADIRLPGPMDGDQLANTACTLWPTIRVVLTSGAGANKPDDLPDCVTFMPEPWRFLDVLVQAEKAIHQPQPPVT
jgi:hypothetical protein